MKMKKKAIIAAVAFAAAMNLSACAYGPPDEDYEDMPQTEEITSFDPAENQDVGVYGPPPEEEYADTTQTEEETSYDPTDNINEDVYGPPIDE